METPKVKIHRCSVKKDLFSQTSKPRRSYLGRVRDKIKASTIKQEEKKPIYDFLDVRPVSGIHQKCFSHELLRGSLIVTPELSESASFQYLTPSPGDSFDENSDDDL